MPVNSAFTWFYIIFQSWTFLLSIVGMQIRSYWLSSNATKNHGIWLGGFACSTHISPTRTHTLTYPGQLALEERGTNWTSSAEIWTKAVLFNTLELLSFAHFLCSLGLDGNSHTKASTRTPVLAVTLAHADPGRACCLTRVSLLARQLVQLCRLKQFRKASGPQDASPNLQSPLRFENWYPHEMKLPSTQEKWVTALRAWRVRSLGRVSHLAKMTRKGFF